MLDIGNNGGRTGTTAYRTVVVYPRQDGFAIALREFGRIERTLFTLDWLQDLELRRRSHVWAEPGRGAQRPRAVSLLLSSR